MIVKEQKTIQIINICGALFNEDLLIKAILWRSAKPVQRVKKVFMHGAYPAVSIYKEKLHIHRLIMSYLAGAWLPFNHHVDHIDGNKLNAIENNLRILNSSIHLRATNIGKKLTEEHCQKITEANKHNWNTKWKNRRVYENPDLLN